MNKSTFLTYYCSKDHEKLVSFIRELPFKIEFKEMVYAKSKWWLWCTLVDEKDPSKEKLKDLDLDKLL